MFRTLFTGLLVSLAMIAKANAGGYAYVDFQHALETVKDGVTAMEKLEKEFKDKQKMLQNRGNEINKMMAEYQKKQLVMTADKRAQEEQTIQKKMQEVKELEMKAQGEMQKRQMDLLQPIQDKMVTIIRGIAEKEGYDLVYAKNSAVIYSKEAEDITDTVISKYNESSSDTTKKKKK